MKYFFITCSCVIFLLTIVILQFVDPDTTIDIMVGLILGYLTMGFAGMAQHFIDIESNEKGGKK